MNNHHDIESNKKIITEKYELISRLHKWLELKNAPRPTGDISEEESVFWKLNNLFVFTKKELDKRDKEAIQNFCETERKGANAKSL